MSLKPRFGAGSFVNRIRDALVARRRGTQLPRRPVPLPEHEAVATDLRWKVQELSSKLAIDADMLLAVLTFERGSFEPAREPTGLVALEQLECMEKLLLAQAASGRNLSDLVELYLAVHHPRVRADG